MRNNNLDYPEQKVQDSPIHIKLPPKLGKPKTEISNLLTKIHFKESETINTSIHIYRVLLYIMNKVLLKKQTITIFEDKVSTKYNRANMIKLLHTQNKKHHPRLVVKTTNTGSRKMEFPHNFKVAKT